MLLVVPQLPLLVRPPDPPPALPVPRRGVVVPALHPGNRGQIRGRLEHGVRIIQRPVPHLPLPPRPRGPDAPVLPRGYGVVAPQSGGLKGCDGDRGGVLVGSPLAQLAVVGGLPAAAVGKALAVRLAEEVVVVPGDNHLGCCDRHLSDIFAGLGFVVVKPKPAPAELVHLSGLGVPQQRVLTPAVDSRPPLRVARARLALGGPEAG
mmetsp:Transcript_138015/g.311175  ORF Transcript_138015/g.311175 Transcript_138015/m.311175 type:complete len:206 (+) Transcript_138015:729-1346(+)